MQGTYWWGLTPLQRCSQFRQTALLVRLKKEIAKKRSFTRTMYRVTRRSRRWQNYMNCTSNCFCTYSILQIWPPATTGCLQTPKECSRESDIGNWGVFWGQRQIVRQKRHRIVREALESVYLFMLMNKVEFCLKVVVLLVRPVTYWLMCYLFTNHIFKKCENMI